MKDHNWKDEHPQYTLSVLEKVPDNPWDLWEKWHEEAKKKLHIGNEIALCTRGETDPYPSLRMILLKYCSEERGFCWYSKTNSEKGKQLREHPFAEMLWYNATHQRQMRARGTVHLLPREDSKRYAMARPRRSQLSALISRQSAFIESRAELEKRYREAELKYEGIAIPVPEDWRGYALSPVRFEFWQGRRDRLHDRICYFKEDDRWISKRVQP